MSKQEKKALVPTLRFLRQDGSDFPAWKFVELKSVAKRTIKKNKGEKVTRALTNSAADGVVDQREYFDKDIAIKGNLESYYIVSKGDYVYNPRVSTNAPVGPISKNKIGTGVMSPLYTVFRFNNHNNDFYEHFFKSSKWHHYLQIVSNSGARHDRMSFSNDEFMRMPVPEPDEKEQQKIADCLSSIDEVITAQTQKLVTLKAHKKGLMQQLFPAEGETLPKLRFLEFRDKGEWEVKELGQLASYTKGFAFKSQDYRDQGVRVIRVSDLGADFIKTDNEKIFIASKSAGNYGRYKLNKDEIIITTVGSKPKMIDSAVGRGVYVFSSNEGLLNQNLLKLEVMPGVNSSFLFSNINTARYQQYIASISRGNANQANIAVKELMKFELKVPNPEEQQKIADCLTSSNDLITAQTQKLEALKTHKKGLMQQLFPVTDEAAA